MTIQGKVVAVTGASSGIGAATARHLAGLGAAVVLGARRTDRLDRLVAEIEAAGGRAAATRVDVTDPEDLRSLVTVAVDRFERLDVLVGNAGISKISPVADLDVEGWSAMVDVNVKGILHGIAAALPVFRRHRVSGAPSMKCNAQGGSSVVLPNSEPWARIPRNRSPNASTPQC